MFDAPSVLCIAGSDAAMGAGLQMDALVCAHFGARFFGISTLETSQSPLGLHSVKVESISDVREGILKVFDSVEVASIKVGALGNASMVSMLSDILSAYSHIPLVIDPVFQASVVGDKGVSLLTPEGQKAAVAKLFPLANVVTPNHLEFESLRLAEVNVAVLLTDGHGSGEVVNDRLMMHGKEVSCYSHERVAGLAMVHGTGCALSTAIACRLAFGDSVAEACSVSRTIVDMLRCIERF